jgi:hypothetical protein
MLLYSRMWILLREEETRCFARVMIMNVEVKLHNITCKRLK